MKVKSKKQRATIGEEGADATLSAKATITTSRDCAWAGLRNFSWSLLFGTFCAILLGGGTLAAEDGKVGFALSRFPLKNEMWMTTARVELMPSRSKLFFGKGSGEVRVLKKNGAQVQQDEVWALTEMERTGLDQESLELEKGALEESLRKLELAWEDELSQLGKKLADFTAERSRMEALLDSEEVSADPSLVRLVEDGMANLDDDASRTRERRDALLSRKAINGEEARLRLDLRRREAEVKRVQRSAEYRAPFQGKITYLGILAERVNHVPMSIEVEVGEALAALQNDQSYEVVLKNQSPILAGVPRESLFLLIDRLREERSIQANYGRTEVNPQDVLLRETLVFVVEEEDVEKARKRTLGQSMAAVYSRLGEKCHLVPKAELIKQLGEDTEVKDWGQVVSRFWPEARLVAEGQSVLAISPDKQ